METLISQNFFNSILPFHPQFTFRSNSLKIPSFLKFPHRKWRLDTKRPIFYASSSANYSGWDDPSLIENAKHSGKLDQFHQFLVSVGIDDRKCVLMFMLGFVSALAISRIRVSSILVVPASVLIFGVGFSLGFVQSGGFSNSVKEGGRNGGKGSFKDENFRGSIEKLKSLVGLFSELDCKIMNLKNEIKGIGEMETCGSVIESISADVLLSKKLVEASISGMDTFVNEGDSKGELVDGGEVKKGLNEKSGAKKREQGASHFDIFKLFEGMFQENVVGAKPIKVKDIRKRESVEPLGSKVLNNQTHSSDVGDRPLDSDSSMPESSKDQGLRQRRDEKSVNRAGKTESFQKVDNGNSTYMSNGSKSDVGDRPLDSSVPESSKDQGLRQRRDEKSVNRAGKTESFQKVDNGNSTYMSNGRKRLESNEYYNYQKNNLSFMTNHEKFMKVENHNENEMPVSRNGFDDPLDLGADIKSRELDFRSLSMEYKVSQQEEQTLKTSNRDYLSSHNRKNGGNGSYTVDFKEGRGNLESLGLDNRQASLDRVENPVLSSSSLMSEDITFDKYLTEANNLVKQARGCLKGKVDYERAEVIFYKSARLLTRAIAMKPMSLLAVGQLGNTYLLHGELKLRTARELRNLLSRSEYLSRSKRGRVQVNGLDDQVISRERLASKLIDVCEECEELLVEAGKKYRMALSIDGSDVRALYNWGLALSYRAQLIADIGPEAAAEADKVYLAAIDKFDAMMSKSNASAPDALFRWGVALQQRSHLRPSNSVEKVKLLHQAKRLFEDALIMDSDNVKVREALSSCVSELK